MDSRRVLIVDDEKNIRFSLSKALEKLEVPVETADSGEEALGKLTQADYDLMLLDLRMPGMDGMEVLRQVSQQLPELKVIIITAYGSLDLAVEAMRLGAVDVSKNQLMLLESGRWCAVSWRNREGPRYMKTIWL